MSRVGKAPIEIPSGVTVNIKGSKVDVNGPKGELSRKFNRDMSIKLEDNILTVSRPSDGKEHRSLHGLTRSLLANMVKGVDEGFEKELEIVGVGYRASTPLLRRADGRDLAGRPFALASSPPTPP